MRYSQANGVHTLLSRLVLYLRSVCVLLECISVILDYPRYDYGLYRTIIIKTCVYTIYTCRAKVPAPIYDHLTITWFEAYLNPLRRRGSLEV